MSAPAGRSDTYVKVAATRAAGQQSAESCGACGQSLASRGWGGVNDDRGRICVPCASGEFVAAHEAAQSREATR